MCISCILEVFFAGIEITQSQFFLKPTEFFPVKITHFIFFFLALLSPSITFGLFPEVDIPIATSPFSPIASIWRENKYLNPKSLAIADIVEVSVTKDKAGIAFRFLENLTVNSVAKCCESEALPPFPKKIIFFFF